MSGRPFTKLKGSPNGTKRRRVDAVAVAELEVEVETEAMLGLTPKQKAFAELYVSRDDLTTKQVALEAGYSETTASSMGQGLLRHPPVVAYIKQLRNELNKKYDVTFESHVRKLAEIRDIALQNGAYAAAVSAEKHRGQAAGLYIDRKEILHGQLDQMSREDVMKEIAKLTEEFPALTAILDTSKVIEHQASVTVQSGQNVEKAGIEVQQETDGRNEA